MSELEEWETEPDELWINECVCLRRSHLGHWCGYVGVGLSHPLYGKQPEDLVPKPDSFDAREYDTVRTPVIPLMLFASREDLEAGLTRLDLALDVHGGVTWAGPAHWGASPLWWIGFDCGHANDMSPETNSYYDNEELLAFKKYRNLEYAKKEVLGLARQIMNWGKSIPLLEDKVE